LRQYGHRIFGDVAEFVLDSVQTLQHFRGVSLKIPDQFGGPRLDGRAFVLTGLSDRRA
jgi:hypothetical protein